MLFTTERIGSREHHDVVSYLDVELDPVVEAHDLALVRVLLAHEHVLELDSLIESCLRIPESRYERWE